MPTAVCGHFTTCEDSARKQRPAMPRSTSPLTRTVSSGPISWRPNRLGAMVAVITPFGVPTLTASFVLVT